MSERLTPVDILNLRFRRSMRGYAIAEVDEFVRRVAADMEATLAESAALRERIGALEREISQFRSLEATMRDALVLAQKAADETRAAAHVQAEAQIQDAQARVRDMETRLQARVTEMAAQVEAIRRERRRLARDLRAQLSAHLDWLTAEMAGEDLEDSGTQEIAFRETAIARSQAGEPSALPEKP